VTKVFFAASLGPTPKLCLFKTSTDQPIRNLLPHHMLDSQLSITNWRPKIIVGVHGDFFLTACVFCLPPQPPLTYLSCVKLCTTVAIGYSKLDRFPQLLSTFLQLPIYKSSNHCEWVVEMPNKSNSLEPRYHGV